ncbi:hypothetical protein CoNPh17_CDS0122 [Staphylococcus phage S-CoN_Ph17]|nr:hypothetical protein CoNPh17_CDS0122 [Staphylococcus phage S-CoN_Ph17]
MQDIIHCVMLVKGIIRTHLYRTKILMIMIYSLEIRKIIYKLLVMVIKK